MYLSYPQDRINTQVIYRFALDQVEWSLNDFKPQLHSHDSDHDSSRYEPDGKTGVCRDGKKRKSNTNTVSHDAPTMPARLIYGSTTTHDGSATIHKGGATNAHDASTIRYDASTIQACSVTTSNESARFSGCHATVPGGGGGLLSCFLHT